MIAGLCAVPECTARTFYLYCIRCEINGQMADHLRELRAVDAVPTEPNEGEDS